MPYLELRKGCTYVLWGGNMSGKSTLLRCLAGQHPKSQITLQLGAGESYFNFGTSVLSATDDPMFLEWSIADNVRIAARNQALSSRQFSENLSDYLKVLNNRYGWRINALDPLFTCSTGARAFVQLARARIHRPPLYLVDEITANLDDAKSEHFIDLLVGLVEQFAVTVVFVSHSERDRNWLERRSTQDRFGGRITLTDSLDEGTVCRQDPSS